VLPRNPETLRPGPRDLVLTPLGLRFMGRLLPCAIGRGGIRRAKREGDGATPAGSHRIVALLYRPDRIPGAALPGWAVPIRPRDRWCDDPDHPDYNQLVRAPHPASAEALRRPDPLYDLVLTTDWNWPVAHPGRGSAIFLHVWRRPRHPTAGCVALARCNLIWVARRITHETRLFAAPLPLACRRATTRHRA
jgi:L,D-peptidoglycan transpeptidase YkuD (ErfK/YbiS/YcfS/YnhG family)